MARQLTNRDLVRCFLQLEHLLVDKLTALVHDVVGVKWALIPTLARTPLPSACSWKRDAGKPAGDRDYLLMLAIPTSYSESSRFGGESGGANDNAGNANELRYIIRGKISDREFGAEEWRSSWCSGSLMVCFCEG